MAMKCLKGRKKAATMAACYNRSAGSVQWRQVAEAVPHLVQLDHVRLVVVDRRVLARGVEHRLLGSEAEAHAAWARRQRAR